MNNNFTVEISNKIEELEESLYIYETYLNELIEEDIEDCNFADILEFRSKIRRIYFELEDIAIIESMKKTIK